MLLVADGKDRPQRLPRAFAGEEILRQRLVDAPLDRAGILCLIDKDVIDTLIKLIVNPWPDAVLVEEIGGAGGWIVVIGIAAPVVLLFMYLAVPVARVYVMMGIAGEPALI